MRSFSGGSHQGYYPERECTETLRISSFYFERELSYLLVNIHSLDLESAEATFLRSNPASHQLDCSLD